jgi:integrase
MKVKLTAGRVSTFNCPPEKPAAFLWDSDAKGFGIKASPGGAKIYILDSRLESGKTLRLTIGDVKTWGIDDARIESRRIQALIDQGIDPRLDKAKRIAKAEQERLAEQRKNAPVREAWLAYVEHHEKHWGTRHLADHINLAQTGGTAKKRGKGLTVQGVLHPLLQLRMADISAQVLSDWQSREAETRANNARQGFELFRAFWRWCATRDEYKDLIAADAVENKDVRAEVPSRKSKRFDVLERSQLSSWFSAVRGLSNPVISAYLQGLLLTGARREELAALRWEDVDFQWKGIWVHDKVAEEGRKIPLTPYLESLLQELHKRNNTPPNVRQLKKLAEKGEPEWSPSPWVFSSPTSADGKIAEPRIPHNRALSIAGLNHVTLHGLRRTFASLAEWVEMPRGVVAQIMGHAPNATAEKHYINRPLELLAVWHAKYEAWILLQAGISPTPTAKGGKRRIEKV